MEYYNLIIRITLPLQRGEQKGVTPFDSNERGRGMCDHNAKKSAWLKLLLSFSLLASSLACGYWAALLGRAVGADVLLTGTVGSAIGALAGVAVLGNMDLLKPKAQDLRNVIRLGGWPLAISLSLFCLNLWGMLAAGTPLADGWPLRVCNIAVMCLFTGLAEEAMFRGLVLQGLRGVWEKEQRGMYAAALLSSLIFGLLHIEWWHIDPFNGMDLVQAALKTIQTGILGFYFAAITIQTGSIVCPALIHGASNFLLMLCSFGLMGIPIQIEYVSSGEDAWLTIVLYLVIIALYIPMAYKGVRILSRKG